MSEKDHIKRKRGLSTHDMETVIEHKDIFIKFMNEGVHYLQIQLALGKVRGNEEKIYTMIETYKKIEADLQGMVKLLKDEKQRQKEEAEKGK